MRIKATIPEIHLSATLEVAYSTQRSRPTWEADIPMPEHFALGVTRTTFYDTLENLARKKRYTLHMEETGDCVRVYDQIIF